MNPYPFEALNHFTVPCSFNAYLACLIRLRASLAPCLTSCPVASGNLCDFRRATSPDLRRDTLRTQKKDCKFVLAAPLNESKGITRATNATVRLTQNGRIVHTDSGRALCVTI